MGSPIPSNRLTSRLKSRFRSLLRTRYPSDSHQQTHSHPPVPALDGDSQWPEGSIRPSGLHGRKASGKPSRRPSVAEVVCAFIGGEVGDQLPYGVPKRIDGARSGRTQQAFELAECQLDRVEIETVEEQVEQ